MVVVVAVVVVVVVVVVSPLPISPRIACWLARSFGRLLLFWEEKKKNTGHSIICENLAGALITLKFIQNVNSLLAPS